MRLEKKHLFVVFLTLVFVLPVALFPRETGQVLGINEVKDSSTISGIVSVDGGHIASGAREVAKIDQHTTNKPLFGKALWDSKQNVKVSTNKFVSGSFVKVTYNGQSTVLLVEAQRDDLTEETVLILNTEAFTEVGANPEIHSSIDVEVVAVQP